MSKKIIKLTVGASCSGKTTWAEQFILDNQDYGNINRDDARFKLFTNGVRDWSLYKFTKTKEDEVTQYCIKLADDLVKRGKGIIVSDTNLSHKTRKFWKSYAEDNGYQLEVVTFDVPWDELVNRHNKRENGVSLKILRDQYLRMCDYMGRKTYVPKSSKPKAFIVDVDGTVADMTGIRKPYEWDKVSQDKPRESVIAMVSGLANSGYNIIFLSGRDGVCYDDTYQWLKEYFGHFETLLMRKADDWRKDYVVKEELFWTIADDYNIVGAIDDRHQVLRLWEELGIKDIINVNRGLYNEF